MAAQTMALTFPPPTQRCHHAEAGAFGSGLR